MTIQLALLRHGQSVWNVENRFTGWADVGLSERGVSEARRAGRLLHREGFAFDTAFTSLLKRASRTMRIVLEEMDLRWIPVELSWRLNERHYGALQGLKKLDVVTEYGPERVHLWRRSFSTRPPAVAREDPAHPRHDRRYAHIDGTELPSTESLEDTLARLIPYWRQAIVPELLKGKTILVVSHENTLRALVMHLDRISAADIASVNIPTAMPLLYEFHRDLTVKSHRYLGEPRDVSRPDPLPHTVEAGALGAVPQDAQGRGSLLGNHGAQQTSDR